MSNFNLPVLFKKSRENFDLVLGNGVGLTHLTGNLVIPLHFEKYRPLAFGLSLAGRYMTSF